MPLWTPAQIPDLFSWWKADAITGLGDNDDLVTWADSSGNGYAVTGAVMSRPKYRTNIWNSLPAISFSGSQWLTSRVRNDWKFLHDTTGSTVFAVWQPGIVADPNAAYPLVSNSSGSSSNIGASLWFDDRVSLSRNNTVMANIGNGLGLAQNVVSNSTVHAANVATLISHVGDPGNATPKNRSTFRVNGGGALDANESTGTPSSANPSSVLVIAAFPGGTDTLVGYIAELVIFDTILSDADRQKMDGYLAHKWGLAGNLPSDHPYKSAPPRTGSIIPLLRHYYGAMKG